MNVSYIESNKIQALENQLAIFSSDDNCKSLLFLMAYEERFLDKDLESLLKKVKKPIIGGVFPEIIFEGQRKKNGVLLYPLAFELTTQIFDLSEPSENFIKQLEIVQKNSIDSSSALFVFTDALSDNKESFIESLFNFFGINTSYMGGGTGSLNFLPFPNIITNNGMYENAAVIGWANKKIALGVSHGWNYISDLLKVTKTEGNQLININWKPAFQVYNEIVEKHSGLKMTSENFFDIAKSYPLGIAKLDTEMIVRDPFRVKDNEIYLIDKIFEGEYVKILHGNMDSLLAGAANAKRNAILELEPDMDVSSVFCIDCISRVLYMQDDFTKELEIIGENSNLNGVLSIGEIANSEESYLEIYNKSIVIGIW